MHSLLARILAMVLISNPEIFTLSSITTKTLQQRVCNVSIRDEGQISLGIVLVWAVAVETLKFPTQFFLSLIMLYLSLMIYIYTHYFFFVYTSHAINGNNKGQCIIYA